MPLSSYRLPFLVLLASIWLFPNAVQAQWSTNTTGIHYTNGRVGIGTASPVTGLHLEGDDAILRDTGVDLRLHNTSSNLYSKARITFHHTNSGDDLTYQVFSEKREAGDAGSSNFYLRKSLSSGDWLNVMSVNGVNGDVTFNRSRSGTSNQSFGDVIVAQGNVGIGTSSPTERLSINGMARAREVMVEASNWPDYVFADDYALRSIDALKQFVAANRRLPGMPSEDVVTQDGQTLGAIQKVLVEKVEELTLYTIEQHDRLESQQNRIETQQRDVDALREQVKLLNEQNDLLRRQNAALRDAVSK